MAENQIFLSYSLADSDTARHVVRAIEERGWPISWERYEEPDAIASLALREALNAANCVVVLWSENSIHAEDVIQEAKIGRAGRILVQAALDDAQIQMPFVLDEPIRLRDEWSVGNLVRQVARVLQGDAAVPMTEERGAPIEEASLDPGVLEVAEAHADAGELEDAIAAYEQWIGAKADDMKAVRRLGDLFLAADREEDAAREYKKVAEHYAASGFLVPAIETYRRIVELAPYVDAYRSRLDELVEKKKTEAAEPELAMAGVQFTVTAPPYIQAGDTFSIDFWAHRSEDRLKIPTRVDPERSATGSALTARLYLDGLNVNEVDAGLHWKDGIGSGAFAVAVPEEASAGSRSGVIGVQFMGLQIAQIHFAVQVGNTTAPREVIPSRQQRHQRAVAAYAPEDRERVMSRIRAFEKAAPGVDIFVDTLDLYAREDGLSQLLDLISDGDVFYLFWSENAAASKDVEREWRYALRLRGIDFIDAILLDPPETAPPPPELAMLHGFDWQSAYESSAPTEAPPQPGPEAG